MKTGDNMYLKVVLEAGEDDQWLRLPDNLEEDMGWILSTDMLTDSYLQHKF